MYVVVLALLASYAAHTCRILVCFRLVRLLAFFVRAGRRVPPWAPAVGSSSFVVAFNTATLRSRGPRKRQLALWCLAHRPDIFNKISNGTPP